jgi:hypothetical protein
VGATVAAALPVAGEAAATVTHTVESTAGSGAGILGEAGRELRGVSEGLDR